MTRAERNEIESRYTVKKINNAKELFPHKINKINKPLSRQIRMKRRTNDQH